MLSSASLSATKPAHSSPNERERETYIHTHTMSSSTSSISSSEPVAVRAWLEQHHHRKQLTLLDTFVTQLRLRNGHTNQSTKEGKEEDTDTTVDRRQLVLQTVELLKHMIGPTSWKSAADLLCLLKFVGHELHHASSQEPAMGNVVRRIMAAVREEAVRSTETKTSTNASNNTTTSATASDNRLSLQSMLWALPQHIKTTPSTTNLQTSSTTSSQETSLPTKERKEFPEIYYTPQRGDDLKQAVMEVLQETVADLEDTYNAINEHVANHIHDGEVILTCGSHSRTTTSFLKAAALKRKITFQVIVCEGAPGYSGHDMAKSLAAAGIDTIVIHDAAIFAVMARVHKVIIPAHAVLANGGIIATSGSNLVAMAAQHHAVPVICITGIFKLCPLFPHEGQDTLNDLLSPSTVMEYAELTDRKLADVEFVNPIHDYIPPDQVTLYVTNVGSFQPSFIYRLLAEYYHTDDWASFD